MNNNLSVAALLTICMNISNLAFSSETEKNIHSKFENIVKQNNLRGTHMLAVVNEEGLSYFTGMSEEDGVFDENTPFLIASHTKAMTSTLLAILNSQKQLDIDAPISSYETNIVTSPKVDTSEITLKKLLTHTSGFTSIQHTFKTAFLGYKDKTDLIDSLNNNMLVAPDYAFRYSKTGPIVASMITEHVTGNSWKTLLDETIFHPLGMNNTHTNISEVDGLLPAITTMTNGDVFSSGHHKVDSTMHPSGGVVSTMGDMALWLKTNINRDYSKLAKSDIFKELHESQVKQKKQYFTYNRDGYSLGWDIATYNNESILTRFGNYGGYSVHVSFMPDHKIGVIAVTNLDVAFALPHVMANVAYNTLLNKDNSEAKFISESNRLVKSIKAEIDQAPEFSNIVTNDDFDLSLTGTYVNQKEWPNMDIFVEGSQIKIKWGELIGILLENKGKYTANFSVLNRPIDFQINEQNDKTLKNGSLVYSKHD